MLNQINDKEVMRFLFTAILILFIISTSGVSQTNPEYKEGLPDYSGNDILHTKLMKQDSQKVYNFDEATGKWEKNSKTIYHYLGGSTQLAYIEYLQYSSKDERWKNLGRLTYNYNASKDIENRIHQKWDDESSEYVQNWKDDFIYDDTEFDVVIERSFYYETLKSWELYEKVKINNNHHNLEELSIILRKGENGKILEDYKKDVVFDSDDNVLTSRIYDWDSENEEWIEDRKLSYEYDNDGNFTQLLEFEWDEEKEKWESSSKTEITDDGTGNLLAVSSNWRTSDEEWENSYKTEYELNDTYTFDDVVTHEISPYLAQIQQRGYIETSIGSQWGENVGWWDIAQTKNYYSSIFATSVNSSELLENTKITPNPASDILNINSNEYEIAHYSIIDKLGQTHKKGKLKGNTIDISELNSGTYFLRIKTNDGVVTKKFHVIE